MDKYKNNDPFPAQPKRPLLKSNDPQGHRDYADALENFDVLHAKFREDRNAWNKREGELLSQFRIDQKLEHCDDDWPEELKDLACEKAWEDGHSSGLSEVNLHMEGVCDFIRRVLEYAQKGKSQ